MQDPPPPPPEFNFSVFFSVGKNIVQQAPCQNHCNAIAKLSKENEQIRKMGQRLKKVYLQAAQTIRDREVCTVEYG